MSAAVHSILSAGTGGAVIDIECHLSNNLPTIIIVGFANRAVGEAKERIRGAFATSHIMLPRKRITVNLAPADIPKADSGFDLAIAVAILLVSHQIPGGFAPYQAVIGELGLDGSTRAVRGIIGKLLLGRAKGITTFYIPSANLAQAQLVPNITLLPIDNLLQLYNHLSGTLPLRAIETGNGKHEAAPSLAVRASVQLSDIVGQGQAKRALEIAAAGGHNVFFSGPPGTGKSMLAKALSGLMPPLSHEEILEVTHLHSLARYDYERIVENRPFRAPHHSASLAAITGGGLQLRPGEISLAHRGILFFDEFPEFSSEVLEALRQPLEDRVISVARAKDTIEYPANFMLVATANPCPCGYHGTAGRKCQCRSYDVQRYRHKLSGPILDRIDLYSNVQEVDHDRLLAATGGPDADEPVRTRIHAARQLQTRRYASPNKFNADMTNADIRDYGRLTVSAMRFLNEAAQQGHMSARSYMRTIKVARTIADLEQSAPITQPHISEALAYRSHTNAQQSA